MSNVFSTRFAGLDTLADIRRLVTVHPDPVTGLEELSPALAAHRLLETLETIFLPNQFSLDFIKDSIDRARSFSVEKFPTDRQYQHWLYNTSEDETFPICLTGLAGIGKSQTVNALRKVMPGPTFYTSAHYTEPHSLISYWYASARGKAGGRQLLVDLLGGDAAGAKANTSELLAVCRRRMNRDAVSLLMLEEMQYQDIGQGIARATDILLTMSGLGIPMIYVANYSLGHKLLSRNSEDKQRLLSEPRIMLPDHPDSKVWDEYVRECIRVSGGRVSADPAALVHELYRWTFGIKRMAVQLIKLAYLEARAARRYSITLDDFKNAYLSAAYSSNRTDVEDLNRISVERSKKRDRLDLRCPFPVPVPSNVLSFIKDDRASRVSEKVFLSSLTAEERTNFEQIHPQGSPSNPLSKPKREKKPALPKQTREGLENAYNRLLREFEGSSKPRGPKQ